MNRKSPIDIIQERIRGFRENTDFVATLFEGLTGYANIAADFDGNIIAYNEEGRKIYGYAPEEVIGKQSIEILFPKSFTQTDRLQEIINDLHEKEKLSYEGEMIHKNGNTFPAQIVLGLTKNKNGKIVGFIVLAKDLTESKRKEEMLMSSETRFRAMIQKNADGIVIVDNDGRTVFVNPAAEALFRRTADELVGEAFGFPLVGSEIAEIDIIQKGGEIAITQMRSTEIEWEGKRAYLASIRDVTEISRARKKIDLLANLVENASYVMIFIVGPDGQIIECNALAGNTFGYSKSEMPTMNLGALFKFKADERWGKIADSVQQESHWRGEFVAMGKDGREFPVDMAVSKSEDKEMESANMICFIRDVSKEKEIDRMKSEFISIVGHELRTPLASLKNVVHIILGEKAGGINENQRRFLSMAHRNIDRLSGIISELLDISKIESGTLKIDFRSLDLGVSLDMVLASLTSKAREKSISIHKEIPSDLPQAYGDSDKLEQIFINLLDNAVKFTPEGGHIYVSARLVCSEVETKIDHGQQTKNNGLDRDLIEVSVADTGIGISPDDLEKVFDRFHQVEESLTREVQGTGLGLSIVKGLVEAHGGKIWVESKNSKAGPPPRLPSVGQGLSASDPPASRCEALRAGGGQGSKFTFTLPIYSPERGLKDHLDREIAGAKEKGAPLSLIILKIEEFDYLSEAYGETEAYKLLAEVKQFVQDTARRSTDIIKTQTTGLAIMILPDTPKEGAFALKNRLKEVLSKQTFTVGKESMKIKLASRVATYPEDGLTANELIKRAQGLVIDY